MTASAQGVGLGSRGGVGEPRGCSARRPSCLDKQLERGLAAAAAVAAAVGEKDLQFLVAADCHPIPVFVDILDLEGLVS